MNLFQLAPLFIFSVSLFLGCFQDVFADTIYQWTDPWGQVKYSKIQVQGSMVSELTELPKSQESTEQQKQDAMLSKMQALKNANKLSQQKTHTEKRLKQQKIANEKNCQILRKTLAELQLKNARWYGQDRHHLSRSSSSSDRRYYYGRYEYYRNDDYLINDLYKEIRRSCR